MQKTSPEIAELKHRIEANLKRKMKTPTDFVFLSGAVFERTRETMSPTTLKRLWGYIDGADQTRNSTLEILSRFLGFEGWEQFVEEIGKDNGSDKVVSPHIDVRELHISLSRQPAIHRRAGRKLQAESGQHLLCQPVHSRRAALSLRPRSGQ